MALWVTSEICFHRKSRSSDALSDRRSVPLNDTRPLVMAAGGRSRRRMASAIVDLPLPDSPAKPNASPAQIRNETSSTTRTAPPSVRYSTRRSSMTRRSAGGIGYTLHALQHGCGGVKLQALPARGAHEGPLGGEARVADLVERVVDQREGERAERDAGARGDERPPRARGQRDVVAGPVEVRAPRDRAQV